MKIPQVNFVFNKKEDLWNIWDTCNSTKLNYGKNWDNAVSPNILKICKNKKLEGCKKDLEKTMSYIYKSDVPKTIIKSINIAWNEISEEYFKELEKIMKSKFYTQNITAYLTTPNRCPYDPDPIPPSFFINMFWGIPSILETIGHELMHIQFHNSKYWKICEKELGFQKTHDLKEALTVLLNEKLFDLWIMEDKGYPNHQELRKYISAEWKKKKDFDILIDKSIKWIKKNGVK
jgi:hypothetical protein